MRKIRIILILILSTLILFTGNIYAAMGKVTIKATKTEVKPKETFTITVSANNSEAIDGLSSKIKYDENILEVVSSELVDNTNWSDLDTFPSLIAIWKTTTSETSSADIYEITFKVKESVTPQDTEIKLTDIILSATSGQQSIEDVKQTIKIKTANSNNGSEENEDNEGEDSSNEGNNGGTNGKDPSKEDNNANGEEKNPGEENNGTKDDGTSEDENKKIDNTISNNNSLILASTGKTYDQSTSGKSLPFTGGMISKIILGLIGVFTIFGINGYVLYKRYRKI